ncbi:MAG: TonB-dependent receptor domain-containing protein [Maricaulaceae bacterium]
MLRRIRRHWCARAATVSLVAAMTVWVAPAHAQVSAVVTVVDATSGDPVRNAAITFRNLDTGAEVAAQTDSQGRARFGGLTTAGRWQVVAPETEQYLAAESEPVALRSSFDQGLTVSLTPRNADIEQILVVGAPTVSRINTTNAEVSATFTIDEIERIPVEARSLDRVLFRLPNVSQATGFFNEAPAVAINGANSLFTNYTIDGLDNNENFLGGQKFPVPVGAIQDVTVLASSYSVEFGRTANGVVNVTTKSGGNDLSGELFFVTRPGGFITADTDFDVADLSGNPIQDDFRRFQAGGALGGAIVEDKTFFFVDVEYTRDETSNQLIVPELNIAEDIAGTNEFLLFTGRLDHEWSPRLRSSLRFNHGRVTIEDPGGGLAGGVLFPSAGNAQDRFSYNAALTTTYVGERFEYSAAFNYSRFDWDFGEALSGGGPQATLLGPDGQTIAILGDPGFIFDQTENLFQTQHKLTTQVGRHRLKFGFDVLAISNSLFGGGNTEGNFLFQLSQADVDGLVAAGVDSSLGVADLPDTLTPIEAIFETQPNAFGATQALYSVYAEDQFQVLDNLSLTFGVRWEYDNLSSAVDAASGDFNNIAPRFAFNYTPQPNLVFRGGVGLFYEKIPYAVISDAIQFSSDSAGFQGQIAELVDLGILPSSTDIDAVTSDGNATVDAVGLVGGPGDLPSGAEIAAIADTLPANELRILNPNGLDNPFALQASLGVQYQLNNEWSFSVDGIITEGRNLVRLIDLIAPEPFTFDVAAFEALSPEELAAGAAAGLTRSQAAADATRPTLIDTLGVPQAGEAGSIIVSDTGGTSQYRAITLTARKARGNDRYDLSVFYTFSSLENDTDDINFRAQDSNNFDLDFGPSLNDRPHILNALVNIYPIDSVILSVAGIFQSGQPVNFIPDATVFGTTDLNGDGLSFADQFTGNPDRFPGETRNSGRLPFNRTVDVGLTWRPQVPGTDNRLEVRADVFNVFNANNLSGFPVNFTASNQIQLGGGPLVQSSAAPPRTFQLSTRYVF